MCGAFVGTGLCGVDGGGCAELLRLAASLPAETNKGNKPASRRTSSVIVIRRRPGTAASEPAAPVGCVVDHRVLQPTRTCFTSTTTGLLGWLGFSWFAESTQQQED